MVIERCEQCGANLAMVGKAHRCIPKSLSERGGVGLSQKAPKGETVQGLKPSASRPAVGRSTAQPVEQSSAVVSKSRVGAKRLGSRGPAPGSGGRPRIGAENKTLKVTQPWKKEGVSQSTWYRRQQEKK